MRSILCHASVLALLLTLMGCEKKDSPAYDLANAGNGLLYRLNKSSGEVGAVTGSQLTPAYDLVNAGNGLLYRLNRSSGEVSLIVGSQLTKLEEWTGPKKEEPKKNYVMTRPTLTNTVLDNLVLELKTNWREGKMYYIFRVSPYAGRIEAARTNSPMIARFDLKFYDSEAFEILTIPVPLAETTRTLGDDGKVASVSVNSTVQCSAETYEAISGWLVSWAGFSEKAP